MIRNFSLKTSLLLLLTVGLFSCQKVIDIDLNEKEPKIVIEGFISDLPGPYTIRITKTINFDEPNEFPGVSGANVVLHDDKGNKEVLQQVAPGEYVINNMQGQPGRTYTLDVTVDGETFTAVSYMPLPVPIDSLTIEESFWGIRQVNVYLKDPADRENYFRLVQYKNGELVDVLTILSDELQNGSNLTTPLYVERREDTLMAGDSILVQLHSIDRTAFDYFRTLMMLVSAASSPSDAPANPISGFTNGALGYFYACGLREDTIVVPKN